MAQGRVVDAGRDVLFVRIDALDAACPSGHSWVILRDELMTDAEAARSCPTCGAEAITAEIAEQVTVTERRGVVLELGAGELDA